MVTYYARADYNYSGGDAKFSIPFPYIKSEHIQVILNGDEENPLTNFEFLTSSQIQINSTLTTGDVISIRRVTPLNNRFVIFTDNNILDEESQNLSTLQVFNNVQEIKDAQDILLSRMSEFINLKSYIDAMIADLTGASETARQAASNTALTLQLIADMSQMYAELQKGNRCTVTNNLFDLKISDHTLEGTEAVGWAVQNTEVTKIAYPDAYDKILDEYENGTPHIYTSESGLAYAHSYTDSSDTTFYSENPIAENSKVYSDIACTSNERTVTDYIETNYSKYKYGSDDYFYISPDNPLGQGQTVYSDNTLTTVKGTVSKIQQGDVHKYTLSSTGTVYISGNTDFRIGKTLYSDNTLETPAGVITSLSTFESVKYKIDTLADYEYFYISKGTTIGVNTIIYADAACTSQIGTISSKGSIISNSSYCYMLGSGGYDEYNQQPGIFYTKNKLSGTYQNLYYDEACTFIVPYREVCVIDSILYINFTAATNRRIVTANWRLVSEAQVSTTTYITIGESTTQYPYRKQGEAQGERIVIDEGSPQAYNLTDILKTNYITLGTGTAKIFSKVEDNKLLQVQLGTDEAKATVYNGIVSGSGAAFPYVEASNGHNIVLSQYASRLTGVTTPFYILNTEAEKIKLPLLDNTKNIYYCVANTIIVPSVSTGVSRAELMSILEDYPCYNSDEWQNITSAIIDAYQNLMITGEKFTTLENAVTTCTQKAAICEDVASTLSSYVKKEELKLAPSQVNEGEVFNNPSEYERIYNFKHLSTKTSVDTIKSDNFSKTGSPTITDDGIASGFSTSNYITKSNAITIDATGEFHIDFKVGSSQYTSNQYILDVYNTNSDEIIIRRGANSNAFACLIFINGSLLFNEGITDASGTYRGYIEYKNGVYTFDINGEKKTLTSSTVMRNLTYNVAFGVRVATGSILEPLINGSIDLNACHFYVNGNLVYQPCLKIPYTESKTGSKIVDVAYANRISDMYNQFGYAPYYMIDEVNHTFTLPRGEMFGYINNVVTSALGDIDSALALILGE